MDQEILAKLKDIHLPPPPSWWPPAIGYIILFIFVVLLFFAVFFIVRLRKPKRLLKKEIKAELAEIETQCSVANSAVFVQSQVSSLLRRILAIKHPKLKSEEFSNIHNELTLIFKDRDKVQELVELLTLDRFKKESSVDSFRLIAVFKELIKKCGI